MQSAELKVLVVDDVNAMRIHVKEVLKQFGFRDISSASNGQEAKQLLDSQPIHLILCDWHMEPVDGIEFLKYVRSHAKHKDLPFIMVTGENTKEQVIQAIQAGVDDFVVKPLTVAQIQNKVFKVLLAKKVLS